MAGLRLLSSTIIHANLMTGLLYSEQQMQLEAGRLIGARQVASPHHNSRPHGEQPSLLVIHNISLPPGEFGGPWIDALFTGTLDPEAHPYFAEIAGLCVSAHCLIRRDGEIVQYVPFSERAWHAGISCWQERECCNDFSIGIELEGTDTLPYTDQQYRALVQVTRLLMQHYPLTVANITGHSDIAPQRKTDPGAAFDWQRYHQMLTKVAHQEGSST